MRKYWVTTHWPPEIGASLNYGVYLYDGTQSVGADVEIGDRVWIYQSKGGKAVLRERTDGSKYTSKRQQGKGGVIALTEVVNKLHDIGGEPEEYVDHTRRWWRWKADTRLINQSGFVPRRELGILLYNSPNCPFHGFGTKRSGLKQIGEEVHQKILRAFSQNQPPETLPKQRSSRQYFRRGHNKGGEGLDHKKLKERVAANPSDVLGEEGLSLIQIEYPFPTGDRADILLRDSDNRYVAVEVEVTVDLDDISGVLQAIKYSHMYAIECRRKFEEIRAFLVAYQISDDVKALCKEYGIETFVINTHGGWPIK
jgi:hypothetical protein